MGRPRITSDLYVFMNGLKVGCLTRLSTGMLRFEYSDSWIQHSEMARPLSLSMPLSQKAYTGDVVDSFFDNLLPDSQPVRSKIQTRFMAKSNRCFDLLWHVGRDCVGAIQLLPDDSDYIDVRRIEADEVSDAQIADILRNYTTMPLGMKDDEFRISIAGAQEKTALLQMDGKWYRPLGVTPTSHIFKLPIGRIIHSGIDLTDSVENEWLCHLILKAYGIPVADTEIGCFEDIKTLIVKRFDRRWADDHSWMIRLPQEDMCQALKISPALKYESDGGPGIENILSVLLGSSEAISDRRLFMKVQVLFWMLGAIDGHAKNFSIFLMSGGGFRLTPLYDVISAFPLIAKKQIEPQKMRMAMSLKGKNRHYQWEKILYRHWISTAKICGFPEKEMVSVINELSEGLDNIVDKISGELPSSFPADVAESVFTGMKKAKDRLVESC